MSYLLQIYTYEKKREGLMPLSRLRLPDEFSLSQDAEDMVELVGNTCQGPTVIQQMCDSTEQVAEQVPRSLLCGDGKHHSVQVNHQSQQIEIERAQRQSQDLAGPAGSHRQGDRHVGHGSNRIA